MLDKLYSLYSKVKDTIAKWKDVSWTDIKEEIDKMKETIDNFDRDCKKLPGQLKQWDAFKELKEEIENMKMLVGSDNDEITGVVKALAKETIMDRHW